MMKLNQSKCKTYKYSEYKKLEVKHFDKSQELKKEEHLKAGER